MSEISRDLRRKGKTIGFVPTMGALHRGHISLISQAVKENDNVVVSIFVNPIQFGPKEDFKRYPRNFSKDAAICSMHKVDYIFYPDYCQMYPEGFKTYVTVNELSDILCGAFRPGHFRGVTTVVAKLFNIVQPDVAYFGQKDAQQAIIIKRMVCDLNIPVKIKVMPIVREKDGLALSSRNQYLNARQRRDAVVLYRALNKARDLVKSGCVDARRIINEMKKEINKINPKKIDYISVVDPYNLKQIAQIKDKALIALAVWLGKTRLIDNIIVRI